ncbi:MAG: insulinase family protein [Armatimonadetes bacterium]|nr:insulinase family protein [Armatimonadota bacterium]
MKRIIFLVICILILNLLSANELIHKTLANGMEIVVKENRNNTSVGFYCFVKTGSVNESKYLGAGISHYLEHIVSSGTTTIRTEAEYEEEGKRIGAIVNAYTTNIATAFHIITDKEYQDEALAILSEQMQFCACTSFEVDREKQVILKEIVLRSTPARSKMYQRCNELIYPNSNNKYPVIGYTELFKTITRDQLEEYYHQRYVPNNMVFVSVGDFEAEEMILKIEEAFKDFERKQLLPVYLPVQNIRNGTIEYIEEFDIQQPLVYMSTILPASDFADKSALSTALEILFEKRLSPIQYKLVEELKLVNYIYSNVDASPNFPEGSIDIVFEAKDVSDILKIVNIIDEELEFHSRSGIKYEDIQNIITRTKANKLLSILSVSRESNRIGWSMMRYGIPDNYPLQIQELEKLTVRDIQNAITKHLLPKNRVICYNVPKGTKELLEQKEEQIVEKTDVIKKEISKNITLIHKFNNEKPFVNGVIYLANSTDYETEENVGTIAFMTDLMFKGSKKYDPLDLTEWFEDHVIRLNASATKNGTYIEFKCLKEDYPELEKIIIDAIKNPSFEESELELAKEQQMADYKRSLSNAYFIHADFVNSALYTDTKFGLSKEEKVNILMKLSREELLELQEKYFNAEKIIAAYYGDVTEKEAEEFAKKIYKAIPENEIKDKKIIVHTPDLDESFVNKYSFEPVNIRLNYLAPTINSEDFNAMKVIASLLRGARGRLHKAVRGTNDLAYYAFADYNYFVDDGYLRVVSQTSIDKKDELVNVLKNEMEKLKNEPVTREEIDIAIEENQKILNSYLNDNQLPYYQTHYEAIGLGYDYINKSSEILKQVTPEDIQRVANQYFKNVAIIISEPDENVELMVE